MLPISSGDSALMSANQLFTHVHVLAMHAPEAQSCLDVATVPPAVRLQYLCRPSASNCEPHWEMFSLRGQCDGCAKAASPCGVRTANPTMLCWSSCPVKRDSMWKKVNMTSLVYSCHFIASTVSHRWSFIWKAEICRRRMSWWFFLYYFDQRINIACV